MDFWLRFVGLTFLGGLQNNSHPINCHGCTRLVSFHTAIYNIGCTTFVSIQYINFQLAIQNLKQPNIYKFTKAWSFHDSQKGFKINYWSSSIYANSQSHYPSWHLHSHRESSGYCGRHFYQWEPLGQRQLAEYQRTINSFY